MENLVSQVLRVAGWVTLETLHSFFGKRGMTVMPFKDYIVQQNPLGRNSTVYEYTATNEQLQKAWDRGLDHFEMSPGAWYEPGRAEAAFRPSGQLPFFYGPGQQCQNVANDIARFGGLNPQVYFPVNFKANVPNIERYLRQWRTK